MKRMFELIRSNSSNPVEDQRALLRSIVLNFLIGNTDCHVKNYSLLYGTDLRSKRLAPIYDLVATRVYKTTSEMSFFIGGELDIEKIDRTNFVKAADEIGMSGRIVQSIFDEVTEKYEKALTAAADELKTRDLSKRCPWRGTYYDPEDIGIYPENFSPCVTEWVPIVQGRPTKKHERILYHILKSSNCLSLFKIFRSIYFSPPVYPSSLPLFKYCQIYQSSS